MVADFLRELGNYDANREMTTDSLMSDDWQKSSEKLAKALLEGSSLTPASVKELIVVPDGLVWYVPFEALVAPSGGAGGSKAPLVTMTKIRYAPTVGLALRQPAAWRRMQRTGLVLGEMVPGDKPEERTEAAAALTASLPTAAAAGDAFRAAVAGHRLAA